MMNTKTLPCEDPNHVDNKLCVPADSFSLHPDGIAVAFLEGMHRHADKIAQIDAETGKSQTYRELLSVCIRIAQNLKAYGLQPGDIVCVCSLNGTDCNAAAFAIYLAGGIFSALDPQFCPEETTNFLQMLQPKFVFCDEAGLNLIETPLGNCNQQVQIIYFGETSKYKKFSEMLVSGEDENGFKPYRPDDLHETVAIFFSSGSTGTNKGICVSHYGLLRSCTDWGCRGSHVFFPITRLCWISSMLVFTGSIIMGSSWVVSDRFTIKDIFRIIEKYEVTCVITSAYYGYQITTQSEYIGDTSKLIGWLLIGGRVSAELIISLRKLLPNTVVLQSYGITETTGLVISYNEDDLKFIQTKPGSMGHVLEGICSKVVNVHTEEVVDGPHKTGEFRLKLDRMFNEYYKNPIATADVFDSEGYFCTGDIVYYDEDSYLYYVDRIKDTMKFRSFYINPLDLDVLLLSHPQIADAVVIGIPHDEDMHHPMALVKPVESATITMEEIREFVDNQVVDYKRLRGGVKFVDNIPRTATTKLQRNAIRDMVLNGEI